MPQFNKIALFTAALLFFFGEITAQNLPPQVVAKLQSKLDSMRSAHDIQGVAASVFYPNQGFWQGATGFSTPTLPISTDMKFGIASNSKLFTAVALLRLQELGQISLNDSLGKWLPPMPNIAPEITIRQLLHHTSGVFDITDVTGYPDSIMNNPNRVFQPEEVVGWVQSPLFAPGTGWSYCNTNYILAGLVLEQATGQTMEQFLRDSILSPAGLNNTFFPIAETVPPPVARPFINNQSIANIPRTSLESAAWTGGAMYSTAADMNLWYQKLLGGQIISPASLTEMLDFNNAGNYGLGIQKVSMQGRTCYVHGGSIRGYRSFALYDVATGAVIAVLCNELPAPPQLVAEALLLNITGAFSNVDAVEYSLAEGIKVYPNPAEEVVFFQNSGKGQAFSDARLILFDVTGNAVRTEYVNSQSFKLDRKELSAGVYFFKLESVETSDVFYGQILFK
jgi:D-alanyl-D-alanine carboxypeptidase